jgi:hypothetical protein
MTSVPGYIPGQDPSGSEFEGFANKDASVGNPIFAAKNEPQAAPGNGSLPPGATETPGYPPRPAPVQSDAEGGTSFPVRPKTSAKTTKAFLKTIGD